MSDLFTAAEMRERRERVKAYQEWTKARRQHRKSAPTFNAYREATAAVLRVEMEARNG